MQLAQIYNQQHKHGKVVSDIITDIWHCNQNANQTYMPITDAYMLEMGQSSADAEVRPNVRLSNVRLFGKFGRTSASLGLRIGGVLRSPLALTKVNTLTISY